MRGLRGLRDSAEEPDAREKLSLLRTGVIADDELNPFNGTISLKIV